MDNKIKLLEKNVIYSFFSFVLNYFIQFIQRSFFIFYIGVFYLGLSSLFLNILSIISIIELGIGSVMIYSLYKPISNNDMDTIKSIIKIYNGYYFKIAYITIIIGLLLTPLVLIFVGNSNDSTFNIIVYYYIFLLASFINYFFILRENFLVASQQKYIISNYYTIINSIFSIIQIFVMLFYNSFTLYLLLFLISNIFLRILVHFYIKSKYPFLFNINNNIVQIDFEKIQKKNIQSFFYHKFGEIAIYNTESIFVSIFVNIYTIGLLSNYNLLITTITSFLNIFLSSIAYFVGSIIVQKDSFQKYDIFQLYRIISFWLNGLVFLIFYMFINDFIRIWIGSSFLLSDHITNLLLIIFLLRADRSVLMNYKQAAGVFDLDKFLTIIQGLISIFFSILLGFYFGIFGILLASLLQGFIGYVFRPVLVFRKLFNKDFNVYFFESFKYLFFMLICFSIAFIIRKSFGEAETIFEMFLPLILMFSAYSIFFIILYKSTKSFRLILSYIKVILKFK
jgi:hypothetical protein